MFFYAMCANAIYSYNDELKERKISREKTKNKKKKLSFSIQQIRKNLKIENLKQRIQAIGTRLFCGIRNANT